MKNIVDYLKVFKNIETYKSPGPRNMAQGGSAGQLVTPSADGSRPGYQGNPNRTYPYTLETGEKDRRLGFDTEKQKHFKKVGKATKGNPQRIIYQEVGESLEDFKLRKTERMTTAVDKTVEARNYIDNWTKNWLDQNLSKYGVKDFEVMLDELSTAWQNEVATGNVPKGKGIFNLTTSELKLPNITTGHDLKLKPDLTPFKYEGFDFYKNLETKGQIDRTMGQWRKMFYKNKIRTTPGLQENLKNFYKFMAGDKKGVYNQPSGLTIKEYYNTQVSDDAKFLLDKDASGLDKNPKKELFNSFDDIKDNYNKYTQDKQKLVRIERLSEAAKKAGPDTAGQAKLVSDRILSQNKIVAEMTPQQLVKDKKFIKSLRTVVNPTTGDLSFTGYTKEDPKVKFGKKVIRNDLELAKHAIERAKNGNLIHAEHISPVASGKLNIGFPNNLQSANYITNAQIDNARRYLKNNPDTPNAKILENNFLKENNLRISGKEYVRPFGVDAPVFTPATGKSDIVERTFIGNTQETPIKNTLDNFWCGTGKAYGGRIGFANGSGCPDSVKRRNFIALNNDVRTGKITGEAAEEIAKKTSDVVAKAGSKSALTKILGPAGFGLDIIYEVASVGTDIYGGKPWREAIQDNWIAGAFMPGTSLEEFHKRLNKKYPETKPYSSGLELEEAYNKKFETIERLKANTSYRGKAEAEKRLPQLERDLEGIAAQYNAKGVAMEPGSPEYENYMAAKTEYLDARKATSAATKAKLEMELNRPTSDRFTPRDKSTEMKIDFNIPKGYTMDMAAPGAPMTTSFKPDLPTNEEVTEYYKEKGYDISPQEADEIIIGEKWRQLFEQPGIRGTQDWRGAGGGMAGIRRPSAIPPESGPMSQGLRSLYNNGRKL
jgi:hypothetical protein